MKYSYDEGLYKVGERIQQPIHRPIRRPTSPAGSSGSKPASPTPTRRINGIIEQLSTFHSSFSINHSEEPSPLLIQSGWNDDLFPVDEALRYYQRTRAQYPSDPISLYLADYRPRAQPEQGRRWRRLQRTA